LRDISEGIFQNIFKMYLDKLIHRCYNRSISKACIITWKGVIIMEQDKLQRGQLPFYASYLNAVEALPKSRRYEALSAIIIFLK
jgi:DNA-nicking Smr family endonuclease